jgi:Zn-dependent peptidase ImmA (M78 family)
MSTVREAVLQGSLEAAQLHADAGLNTGSGTAPIDVYEFIANRDIDLVFHKLGGLLGAYLEIQRPGILVTTERPLAIQRFTAAHELGHAVLKHKIGVDGEDMLRRSPFGGHRYDLRETAADAFAAMFLMPDFLINSVAEQQKWDYKSIRDPRMVYQMSLRMGVSFEALTRTLVKHKFLEPNESQRMLAIKLKDLKMDLLGGSYHPDNWHCNIWQLTEKDESATIIAEPKDLFIVRLREMSGAGYLWDLDEVRKAGYQVLSDTTEIPVESGIGGDVQRIITARPAEEELKGFTTVQNRPWDPIDVVGEFHVNLQVRPPEFGLLQSLKQRALAA